MDSNDDFSRAINLVFILDGTDNISDEAYASACELLNSFGDSMVIDGIDCEVSVVIASTDGSISEPVPLDEFKYDPNVRRSSDVSMLLNSLTDALRRLEHPGSDRIVDNVIIFLSNGRFLQDAPRAYIDVCRNWRYTRTPKLLIHFGDDCDIREAADIVGSGNRVFGEGIFDDIKIHVLKGGIEFHKLHEVREISTVYSEEQGYRVDRKSEEHEAPVEDVYDM